MPVSFWLQQLVQKARIHSSDGTSGKSTEKEEEVTSATEMVPSGEYETNYETLQSIGKGAFGFVKLAKRREDNQEVGCEFSALYYMNLTD